MDYFEYLTEKRKIIQKDEWKAYNFLKDLYLDENVSKPMFVLACGLTAGMLTYAYVSHWKEEETILSKLEQKVNG